MGAGFCTECLPEEGAMSASETAGARGDRAEPRYAELHCTSNFSFLRGASHPDELVQAAAALGYEALAITDRDTLAGLVDYLVSEGVPIPTPDDKQYYDKIGAFEGAGYVPKGVYRPMHDCLMRSFNTKNFCPVCNKAILEMIKSYTE